MRRTGGTVHAALGPRKSGAPREGATQSVVRPLRSALFSLRLCAAAMHAWPSRYPIGTDLGHRHESEALAALRQPVFDLRMHSPFEESVGRRAEARVDLSSPRLTVAEHPRYHKASAGPVVQKGERIWRASETVTQTLARTRR